MNKTATKENKNAITILSYALIGILLLVVHAFMQTGTHDDAWFGEMLGANNSLFGYLMWRYQEWSSRIPVEAAFVLFTGWNLWVWRIVDSLMILLMIYSISKVFVWENRQKYILPIFVLLALIPLGMLHSAGWITTTICYIWPAALGLYAMIPLRKWFDGEKPAKYEYITVTLALLFATSQEQVTAIILCTYLLCGVALYKKQKKLQPYFWVVIAICVLAIANIMICPGNAIRNEVTIANSFPEFPYLTFGQKFYMGYVSTFSFFVSCEGFNMIFVALTGTLAVAVFYKYQDLAKANVTLIPFLCTFIPGWLGRVALKNGWIEPNTLLKLVQNNQLQQFTLFSTGQQVVECVLFAVIFICVLVEIYWVFGKTWQCLLAYMILFAGIASRMIMGFTPSIYISAGRTAFFCCIAFLIVTLLTVQECCKWKYSKAYIGLMSGFYVLLLIGTIYFENFTRTF